MCVCVFLIYSLACAAGATEHLPWMNEAQEDAGRALVMGTDWTAPAPAPVRNIQAPHKCTHTPHTPLLPNPRSHQLPSRRTSAVNCQHTRNRTNGVRLKVEDLYKRIDPNW